MGTEGRNYIQCKKSFRVLQVTMQKIQIVLMLGAYHDHQERKYQRAYCNAVKWGNDVRDEPSAPVDKRSCSGSPISSV